MKQRISLQLLPTPEQQQRLLELLHTFNAACAAVAAQAQTAQANSVFALQALSIETLLGHFRLPMPLALRAVLAVSVARERHPSRASLWQAEAAIPLDEQLVAFQGLSHLSLPTLRGRVTLPYFVQRTRRTRSDARLGEAALGYQDGHFYLTLTLDMGLRESTLASTPGHAV